MPGVRLNSLEGSLDTDTARQPNLSDTRYFFSISSRLIRSVVAQQKLILGQIFRPPTFFAKFAIFFSNHQKFLSKFFTLTKLGDDVIKLFSDYGNITFNHLGPKQFLSHPECLIVTTRKESFKALNQEANL